jgi:hypothetical protein
MAKITSPTMPSERASLGVGIATTRVDEPLPPKGRPKQTDTGHEDTTSGDILDRLIATLPAGGQVAAATAAVTGATFHGRIAKLQGARVTASPLIRVAKTNVPATATERAFIADFGRSISVLGLELVGGGTISLVVPWMGTDFAADSIYQRGALVGGVEVGLSGLETTKLLIQVNGSSVTPENFGSNCIIRTGTLPSNVRASLNGRLPFWTQPGPLDGKAPITGLAEDLNALLASADARVAVKLTLTTDTPGVLELDFDAAAAQVDLSAQARWAGKPGTDVALAALQAQTVAVPLATDSTATWQIRRLIADVTGDFPSWRAYPAQDSDAPGDLGLKVDATFSVARRLRRPQDIELHGIALLLRAPAAPAELHVELMPGADGPPPGAKPLAAAELTLQPGPDGPVTGWHEVLFDAPVTLPAGGGAWLVVQARTGAAEWVGAAEPASLATTTLGAAQGGRWDRYPPVGGAVAVAQTRLLRTPLPTENDPLLSVAWADLGGAAATADPGREPAPIELPRPDGTPLSVSPDTGFVLALSLTAASSGTLSFQRATTFYREKTP